LLTQSVHRVFDSAYLVTVAVDAIFVDRDRYCSLARARGAAGVGGGTARPAPFPGRPLVPARLKIFSELA
jgi:hypothetical protein